jgi:sugar phosphate isomerase/epimerase
VETIGNIIRKEGIDMAKIKAAWIGFMDYAYIANGGDPFPTYEKYAKMGYQAMDGDLSRLAGDKAENLKRFQDLGLKCISTWSRDMHELKKNPDEIKKIAENCAFYGIDNVNIGNSSVISSFGSHYGNNGTYDSMMQDIESMDALVKLFGKEGVTCVYHNHYQEFLQSFKGVSVMDWFLTQIDPRFKLKLDIGWVYVGGLEPVEYMEKIKDRIALLHIKDFTEMIQPRYLVNSDKETDFGFTAVGTGKLDLRGILGKAAELGIEYAIVEQDRMRNLSREDSMLCAYLNMKETGFVE